MMHTLTAFSLFTTIASAAYTIQDDYSANKFASMFDFFTDKDPTDGFVNYVDQGAAQSSGLYKVQNNQVYMGVDSTSVAGGRGRDSIRISSKKAYNHGLFILDLAHMPSSTCGTWPAFWLLGAGGNWPNNGEIDIIEGVNTQQGNSMAMHTGPGCSITNTGSFAGTMKTSNCDAHAPNQASNVGCSVGSNNPQSYGSGFNSVGGGVYATEWTSKAVSVWFFPRSAIPADITSGSPNPSNWGLPTAQFAGSCDIDKHIQAQQIVFDITFCGQWAGEVWSSDSTCKAKAGTCQDFVKNNPTAFKDTYWTINSLRVFQENGVAPAATPTRSTRTLAPTDSATTVTLGQPSKTNAVTVSTGLYTRTGKSPVVDAPVQTRTQVADAGPTTPTASEVTAPVVAPQVQPATPDSDTQTQQQQQQQQPAQPTADSHWQNIPGRPGSGSWGSWRGGRG